MNSSFSPDRGTIIITPDTSLSTRFYRPCANAHAEIFPWNEAETVPCISDTLIYTRFSKEHEYGVLRGALLTNPILLIQLHPFDDDDDGGGLRDDS